jgi:hypothetical protein
VRLGELVGRPRARRLGGQQRSAAGATPLAEEGAVDAASVYAAGALPSRAYPTASLEEEVSVPPSSPSEPISYAVDIKPLFRERDRSSMLPHFDLWSYDDVSDHSAAILSRLEQGSMPCDGAWPGDRVELFRSWLTQGAPA